MEFIRHFHHLNKDHASLAGGKGASLGEMTNAGIPVPAGFVVLAGSFDHFIETAGLKEAIQTALNEVNPKDVASIDSVSSKIRQLILDAEMPEAIAQIILSEFKKLDSPFVAVRSSATAEDSAAAAWAGQLESYLNTTETDVLEKVKLCWSSLFTPRAIYYRYQKGLHEQVIAVAVVVQKMVNSLVSGIAFSVHPVTKNYDHLIIEAGHGLGEAIVSGQVTPDNYVVHKPTLEIHKLMVNKQSRAMYRSPSGRNQWKFLLRHDAEAQKLTHEQILELAQLVVQIEQHYGFPCDIEWAHDGDCFHIVQSRPITTLG